MRESVGWNWICSGENKMVHGRFVLFVGISAGTCYFIHTRNGYFAQDSYANVFPLSFARSQTDASRRAAALRPRTSLTRARA